MYPRIERPKEGLARWWPLLLAEARWPRRRGERSPQGAEARHGVVRRGLGVDRAGSDRGTGGRRDRISAGHASRGFRTGEALHQPDPGAASGYGDRTEWPSIRVWRSRARRTLWLVYLLPVLIGAPFLYLMLSGATANPSREARIVNRLVMAMGTIYFLASVVVALVVHRWTQRKLRMRLGADHTRLHFDPGTGEIERDEWRSVLTDKTSF